MFVNHGKRLLNRSVNIWPFMLVIISHQFISVGLNMGCHGQQHLSSPDGTHLLPSASSAAFSVLTENRSTVPAPLPSLPFLAATLWWGRMSVDVKSEKLFFCLCLDVKFALWNKDSPNAVFRILYTCAGLLLVWGPPRLGGYPWQSLLQKHFSSFLTFCPRVGRFPSRFLC